MQAVGRKRDKGWQDIDNETGTMHWRRFQVKAGNTTQKRLVKMEHGSAQQYIDAQPCFRYDEGICMHLVGE